MERVKRVSLNDAIKMLPRTKHVHIRKELGNILLGVDYLRTEVIELLEKNRDGIFIPGPVSIEDGHGLAVFDGERTIFIETKR